MTYGSFDSIFCCSIIVFCIGYSGVVSVLLTVVFTWTVCKGGGETIAGCITIWGGTTTCVWIGGETLYETWWLWMRGRLTGGYSGGLNWTFWMDCWAGGMKSGERGYLWLKFEWKTLFTLELWREGTTWTRTGTASPLLYRFAWLGSDTNVGVFLSSIWSSILILFWTQKKSTKLEISKKVDNFLAYSLKAFGKGWMQEF